MGAVCSLHGADVRQRWNIVIHFGFLMTSCDRNISARMKICALSLLGCISAPQLIFSLKRYCSRIFCEQKFSMPVRALKTSRMPRKKIYHLLTSIILVYTYPRQHLSLPNQCSCTSPLTSYISTSFYQLSLHTHVNLSVYQINVPTHPPYTQP